MLKPAQWKRPIDTKQKLMEKAGMQPLTKEEYDVLMEYLLKNAPHLSHRIGLDTNCRGLYHTS
jgi:hypothetical protein